MALAASSSPRMAQSKLAQARIAQAADHKGGERDQRETRIPGQVFTSLECADEGKSWTTNRIDACFTPRG